MKLKSTILSTLAALALGTAASAATIGITEGNREHVIGTVVAPATGTGIADTDEFDLTGFGTLVSGSTLEIYGRIINNEDTYIFSSNREFRVQWIFDGYSTLESGFVADSGFVATPTGSAGAPANISITDLGTNTTTPGIASPFQTDIIAANGSNIQVFSSKFSAGTYALTIDGLGNFPIDTQYDLRITAVPLPAGALLLLTGLAGLGVARRRQS